MAELNSQDFEALSRAIRDLSHSIDPAKKGMDDLVAAQVKYKKEIEDRKEKDAQATAKAINQALSFTKGLANSNSNFTALNPLIDLTAKAFGSLLGNIPLVGGALKGMAEGVGEATKFMVGQLQEGWNAYRDLSDIGVASSFEDMQKTAGRLDLTFQDVNVALKANVSDLAAFGGTVGKGLKEFTRVGDQLSDARDKFQQLGISAAEFTQFQIKYQAQETRLGRARNQDLAASTENYIKELDTLSKLTGASRKDLQANRDAALSETRFAAKLAQIQRSLDPKQYELVRKNLLGVNDYLVKTGRKEIAGGVRDLIGSGGRPLTDAARAVYQQTGGVAAKLVRQLNAGSISQEQFLKQLQASYQKTQKRGEALGGVLGDTADVTRGFAEAQAFANAKLYDEADVKDIENTRGKVLDGQEEQTTSLAKANKSLYNTSKNIQLLATSSTVASAAVEKFADIMEKITDKMADQFGVELGKEYKLRKDLNKKLKEEDEFRKRQKHLDDMIAKSIPNSVGRMNLERQKQKEAAAFAKQGASSEQLKKIQQLNNAANLGNADFSTGFAGYEGLKVKGGESIAGGDSSKELKDTALTVQNLLGGKLNRFTAFNDAYHQGDKVSYPSAHKSGKAFDFTLTNSKEHAAVVAELKSKLQGYEIKDEYANPTIAANGKHLHVEMRRFGGGVKRGGQYLVGENGPEVITAGGRGHVTPNEVFNGAFKMMGDKLDHIAHLMEASVKVEQKILQRHKV